MGIVIISDRIFKQSQLILQLQNPKDRGIHHFHIHFTGFHKAFQFRQIGKGHHIHIQTCPDTQLCSFLQILCHTVVEQLPDIRVIRNDHGITAPPITKDIFQQPFVTNAGHPIHRNERRHHHIAACIQCLFKRRQIYIVHFRTAAVRRGILHTRLTQAVGSIMLHTGCQGILILQILSPKAANHGSTHSTANQRRFTGTFHTATPTRIPDNIHHRRKTGVDTAGRSLNSTDATHPLRQIFIKAATHSQRNGKYRAESMDNIPHQNRRNFMRVSIPHFPDSFGIHRCIGGTVTDQTAAKNNLLRSQIILHHRAGRISNTANAGRQRNLSQLTCFFRQGHGI